MRGGRLGTMLPEVGYPGCAFSCECLRGICGLSNGSRPSSPCLQCRTADQPLHDRSIGEERSGTACSDCGSYHGLPHHHRQGRRAGSALPGHCAAGMGADSMCSCGAVHRRPGGDLPCQCVSREPVRHERHGLSCRSRRRKSGSVAIRIGFREIPLECVRQLSAGDTPVRLRGGRRHGA